MRRPTIFACLVIALAMLTPTAVASAKKEGFVTQQAAMLTTRGTSRTFRSPRWSPSATCCRAASASKPSRTASPSRPAAGDWSMSSSTTRRARRRSRTTHHSPRLSPVNPRTTSTTRRSATWSSTSNSAGWLMPRSRSRAASGTMVLLELPRDASRGVQPRHPVHQRGGPRLLPPAGGLAGRRR